MTTPPEPHAQGELIRDRLDELGISRYAAAKELGVSESFIAQVVKGTRRITAEDTVRRTAELLGIHPDALHLAIDRPPPDIVRLIVRYPKLIPVIRKLGARLEGTQP